MTAGRRTRRSPARPARRPRTPAGEVTAGTSSATTATGSTRSWSRNRRAQADAAVEITGRLTEPEPGEPAGPFTLTVPAPDGKEPSSPSSRSRRARSGRLFPGHDAAAGTGRAADARSDRAPAETAGHRPTRFPHRTPNPRAGHRDSRQPAGRT